MAVPYAHLTYQGSAGRTLKEERVYVQWASTVM